MKLRVLATAFLLLMLGLIVAQPVLSIPYERAELQEGLTEEEKSFIKAIDIEYAWSTTAKLAGMGTFPDGQWAPAGSEAAHRIANFIKDEMKRIGLKNVTLEPVPVHAWEFRGASLKVLSPEEREIPAASYGGSPGTPPEGITAELVYVGNGRLEDFRRVNARGKIVLITMDYEALPWISIPVHEAELHGAIGAVVHWIGYHEHPGALHSFDLCGRPTLPVISISHNDARYLIDLIERGEKVIVNMVLNATLNFNGIDYNVVGYIPGTEYPDQYIIIGDHFDKWFYGARDDCSGVAGVLTLAKAFIESGYKPRRTLVFIAHCAEEYGWTNTPFDWLIGSWHAVSKHHPEWAGRTLAYFNLELHIASVHATALTIRSSQELYSYSQKILDLLKDYISEVYPEEPYAYYPVYSWSDDFCYAISGIPVVDIRGYDPVFTSTYYHTQFDTMELISKERFYVSLIAYGVYAIRLDRSVTLPYDFTVWCSDLLEKTDQRALIAAGIDPEPLLRSIEEFRATAERALKLADIVAGATKIEKEKIDLANNFLLECARLINSRFTTLGGSVAEETYYPHEQYQSDFLHLSNAIRSLEVRDVDSALSSLEQVTGMDWGVRVSYNVYKWSLIDIADPRREDLFWATGRVAMYTDVYHEYFSLLGKKLVGITDYRSEIESLRRKMATLVDNLRSSVASVIETLNEANQLLSSAVACMLDALPAEISLTPNAGVASITIAGSYFSPCSKVTITWEGKPIPTVPSPVITDEEGSFVAIISVPAQTRPGTYTIKAVDEAGEEAAAIFTVVDIRGPPGPPGPQGPMGPQGPAGPAAPIEYSMISVVLAIVAIIIAIAALLRLRKA